MINGQSINGVAVSLALRRSGVRLPEGYNFKIEGSGIGENGFYFDEEGIQF